MSVKVGPRRLSLLWCEIAPSLIGSAAGVAEVSGDGPSTSAAPSPLPGIGTEATYASLFDALWVGESPDAALELPWARYGKNYFWLRYLEDKPGDELNGRVGWKQLVPFRERLHKAMDSDRSVLAEGYYHPFGFSLVVTLESRGEASLDAAVDEALGALGDPVPSEPGSTQSDGMTVQDLISSAQDVLRRRMGKPHVSQRSPTPFTVMTVLQGTGVDPSAAPPNNGEVHRALHGFTHRSASWRQETPEPLLGGPGLDTRRGSWAQGDVLYASNRGRAVWFPRLFTPRPHVDAAKRDETKVALQCYHRNVVVAALQSEALIRFVQDGASRVQAGESLAGAHVYLLRRAAGLLGRMHGGEKTYRSYSIRAHIEDSGVEADLNTVRDALNLPPVSFGPSG